jgi:serine/threonine-protein kinase
MRIWDRFKKTEPAATTPSRAPTPERAAPTELTRLALLGAPGGPTEEEALQAFATVRGTPDEGRAVDELLRIHQARALPESVLLMLGTTLLDRGETEAAARALALASSLPALVLLADLAEQRGELREALSYIERVLLRDLDYPGARERHRRWRAALGFEVIDKPTPEGATVVAREPDAPFELIREVGRGGAAAVYQAVDRELGRNVALKVYHHPERDRSQLAHEAQVAVLLEGPGIVRVFDIDPSSGWIALEWAPAGALRTHIRNREIDRLVPLERWVTSLAQALARVHAAGWVHHDVKPANILLSRTNSAILTDFGTARRIGEPSPPGSLGYMSPERMAGRASDPRDDIYGFGRVLEDALAAIGDATEAARYRALASACTGADAARPADARALLTRLRVEV